MYRKIIVPLDGSKLAECVLPHVEAIARGCQVDSVVLVRVVEPIELPTRGGIALSETDLKEIELHAERDAQNYLDQVEANLRRSKINAETKLLKGKAAESIAEYAEKSGADLLVLATHGRSGISRWFWGSVGDRILHSSRIPVLIVPAPGCVPNI